MMSRYHHVTHHDVMMSCVVISPPQESDEDEGEMKAHSGWPHHTSGGRVSGTVYVYIYMCH